jgi:hypothetical protein
MKLGHLLLCLAQSRRRLKGLGPRLAFHPARQAEVGTVAWIIAFGAMTVGFTALPRSGSDRASPEIADGGKLAEQVGSFGLPLRQRVSHMDLLLLAYTDA